MADGIQGKEEIIKAIMGKTGLAEGEVKTKILEKQDEYGGLLTEAAAAYSIAKDMGIAMAQAGEKPQEDLKVRDLREGLEGVTIKAVVSHVFPVKSWEKGDRSGRVSNILARDATGEIRVVLWNEDCALVESGKLAKGAAIVVENASVRKSNEMLDLSLGMRGRIRVLDSAEGLPEVVDNIIPIDKLEEGMNDISVFARVVRKFPVHLFEVEGRKGKVANMIVSDGNEAKLALWNENADWADKVSEDDVVKVEGAYVKSNAGKLELNLGWRGHLIPSPQDAPVLPELKRKSERAEIVSLKQGDSFKEVRATIVNIFPPTVFEVCPKCGAKAVGGCEKCDSEARKTLILNMEMDDGTGSMRAVLFRDVAERMLGFGGEEYATDNEKFKPENFLGKEMVLQGQVKGNEAFNRLEFVVRAFSDVDVEKEIKALKR